MKNYIILSSLLLFMFGCNQKRDLSAHLNLELGTIKFSALQSNQAFSGALEIFPCTDNTTSYVGNYYRDAITVINPSCVIRDGAITGWGYQLLLPIGTYNMVYWGVSSIPFYAASRIRSPGLTLGVDLSTLFWSLALSPDKVTYMPVMDQVMAVQDVSIGASNLSVNLERKVAGLNIVIKNSNGTAFDPSIDSFEVLIGGIAQMINCATGEPQNQTKTVRFALTIDPSRIKADNVTAMLYPSAASPEITIKVNLQNGQIKTYTTNLKNAFTANSAQTITILMADILSSDPNGSNFTVDDWNETSQTIDL